MITDKSTVTYYYQKGRTVVIKAFECRMCGQCCYGEGGVFLKKEEIGPISRFLGISKEIFLERYCEKRNGKDYISSGDDNYCVFFDKGKQCLIHTVKPERCSSWPFYPALLDDEDNWRLAQDACPGINRDCSFENFKRGSQK